MHHDNINNKISFFRPVISSASTERIIHWSMPDGEKIKEITPTDISINCISVNPQGALVAAGKVKIVEHKLSLKQRKHSCKFLLAKRKRRTHAIE